MESYLEIELKSQILEGKTFFASKVRSSKRLSEVSTDVEVWDAKNLALIRKYFPCSDFLAKYQDLPRIDTEKGFLEKKKSFFSFIEVRACLEV